MKKLKNVKIQNNKYIIELANTNKYALMIAGSGLVNTKRYHYEACQKTEPETYNIITKHISNEPFIKLSDIAINTNHIEQINIKDVQYHIISSDFDNASGFFIAGSGYVSVSQDIITVDKNNASDYQIISDWISKV